MAGLFTDGELASDPGSIVDYETTRGELFAAGAEDAFNSPWNIFGVGMRQTNFLSEDLKSLTGEAQRIDQKTAQAEVTERGLDLKIPVGGITRYELDALQYLKQREISNARTFARPRPLGGTAAAFAGGIAGSLADPVTVATSFIPVVGQARYAKWLAAAGEGVFARTAVRAGAGAIEGVAGAAITEPLAALGASAEQRDYELFDSFLNLTFGGAIGGGLHMIGGAIYDRAMPASPVRDFAPLAPEHVKRDAMQAAVAALERGEPVDVEPMFAGHQARVQAADAVEAGKIKAEIEAVKTDTSIDQAALVERVDALQSRAEQLHPPAVQSFTTAKGSTYQVHEDGTTSRNKAFRPEHGEAEQGAQPRTERTVYITSEQASALGTPQGSWRMFQHADGTVSLITPNKNGGWGVSPSAKNIPVTTTPQKGLIPLELWKPDLEVKGPAGTAYRRIHFGNEITEVRSSAPTAGPRGLADLIPEAKADRTEAAFNRQFGDQVQETATAEKAKPKDRIEAAKTDADDWGQMVEEYRGQGLVTEGDDLMLRQADDVAAWAERRAKAFEAAAGCIMTTR